ncbi:6-hydroxy-D-nicotine oxidase [Madurella mycetomatis]|uniref:6-hydroxy-D-nicotine oxidase n=1 Tax=Madurella mycetomatis TaxID=100816 RepID=A0A175VUT2_9PEZI|nr:6-hydroxy-D-nicotine oxidase [Madurella mycetomatis]
MASEVTSAGRNQPLPGASREQLAADAPELLPLLDACTSILIYTQSVPTFHDVWLGPNCRYSTYPRAIVCPRSDTEVARLLRLSSGLGPESPTGTRLPITVRGGAHDSFGRSTLADGIVLDTRHLDTIALAADKKTVRVGAGVLGGELLDFLAPHGVFAPAGYCSTVGYTGWCLGGGFGVYTASYGAGAEGVVGARLVTADGRVVDTDHGDDPELLWGLRGAGNGNFGVVVEVRAKVYPEPKILGGYVGYPNDEAERLLELFGTCYENQIPDEFNGDIIWAPIPDIGPVVSFMFVWTPKDGRDLRAGWAYLEKLKGLGTVVQNTVEETTPAGFLETLDGTFKDFTGAPFYVLSPTVARHTREFGHIIASRPVLLNGHVVGGTHFVHGVFEKHNPNVVLPNTRHITITLFGAAEKHHDNGGPEMAAVRDWVDGFVADVEAAGIALPPSYVSFSPSDIDIDAFYGEENADRLRALKARYDPSNLFALAYPSIKPRA